MINQTAIKEGFLASISAARVQSGGTWYSYTKLDAVIDETGAVVIEFTIQDAPGTVTAVQLIDGDGTAIFERAESFELSAEASVLYQIIVTFSVEEA
jgi:hypothetical protein